MNAVKGAGKWFSRYDLTLSKLQKVLGLIGTASLVTTAIVLGGTTVLLVAMTVGLVSILVLAYGLDRSGFQRSALEELFEQQNKMLWLRQEQLDSSFVGLSMRMTDDELVQYIRYWSEELRVDEQMKTGLDVVIERLEEAGKPANLLKKMRHAYE